MCRKDIAAGVISASYYLPYEMLIILCNTLIAIFTMISKHSRVVMLFDL